MKFNKILLQKYKHTDGQIYSQRDGQIYSDEQIDRKIDMQTAS